MGVGLGCSKKPVTPPPAPAPAPSGTSVYFTLGNPVALKTFFDFPWPSDLRLLPQGTPDFRGFPNPTRTQVQVGLVAIAEERPGFPVVPTGYFRFSDVMPSLDLGTVIPADPTQSLLLIDIDPASTERGKLFPVVASVVAPDAYAPSNLLAMAPRPGIVLRGKHTYAFVVRRSFNDGAGKPLGVPQALWDLENGRTPQADNGAQASTVYAPLWTTLNQLGIAATDVAAATTFTTGDVVADLASLSTTLATANSIIIQNLGIPSDGGARHPGYSDDAGVSLPGYCEVDGEVASFPKFQQGDPPFDVGGTFVPISDGGLPSVQGSYDHVPIALTFPQGQMPAGGYPLVVYFHGSGGLSRQVIDRGTAVEFPDGGWQNTPGQGPAFVLAPYGFAAASAALPLNPERLPGADELAYLNISNLAAFRDTFRQGVIEQHMFIAALRGLQVNLSSADLATCGISLPSGETTLHYQTDVLFAQGQSMGGMYTNLIGSTEPDIQAVVPTGAGGFWQYFVLNTPQIPGQVLLSSLLGTGDSLTWHHPTLMLLEMAWEPVDPMVFTPRLARRPLPGHPVRPIYEPVGIHDSYFATETYDAMALAYGNREAGDVVWPTMQDALTLQGLGGVLSYPISNELQSESGTAYTGVVAQYTDPTGYDGHDIFTQVDGVKHQYACFLSTMLANGHATVVAPAAVGSPCQ